MSTPSRPLASAIDHTSPTSVSTDPTSSSSKRQKTNETSMMASNQSSTTTNPINVNPTSILTYEVVGSGVEVQVLSTQTILQLIAVVCDETVVGMNEGVHDHMWIVHDPMEGKSYESGEYECRSDLRASCHRLDSINAASRVGHQLILEYDYGSTSAYQLALKSVDELADDADRSLFPRRAPLPGQANFAPYTPVPGAANLNEMYPDLNSFLFEKDDDKLEIYFFQPGKKKVQGWIRKEYDACCHMIHLPEKFGSVDEMLSALNESVLADKPSFHYEWYGVTLFPRNGTSNRLNKYKSASTAELDITVERGSKEVDKSAFLKTFPKTAAAAGFNQNGKPSKANERGWIWYRNGILAVCRGNSKNLKSNGAPSPGVFDGANKHEPESDDTIVGKINIGVKSLQELFCAAEALW